MDKKVKHLLKRTPFNNLVLTNKIDKPRTLALDIIHNISRTKEDEAIDTPCPNGHVGNHLVGYIATKQELLICFCSKCNELYDKHGFIVDIWDYTAKLNQTKKPFIFR
jgi:hypothetical protein